MTRVWHAWQVQKQKELHAQSKKGVRDVYATRIQSKFRG